ncbi:transcriptional regulator [Shewanella mangrovi]|uniref:Transcription antitermination protein RfaH n=1 Tax=Shewanella mangrovi TaxID=1515746 RepID=A0A094JWT4_9GAMM|nr:transcription/translation regulatory transformer protein RfaH [Shewanella mangrovi]KFZ36871.1 transcriptional regulator [Shewanella mangrovi]
MKGWYLLYCKPKSEQRAQLNLGLQGLETYLPMIKVEKKEKGLSTVKKSPLFPNYLFVNFDPTEFSVSKIHSTRGVSRLVDCSERMIPLADIFITRLKLQELEAPLVSARQIKSGEQVKFTSGPFCELSGIFHEKCGDRRCKVLFKFLGKQQEVEVDESELELVTI